jgi:hypothetical protein
MANHASHAALPYPIANARYSVLIPYLDGDGDPTAPTTPDTEISKDNGAAADCAEEVSATSGMDGMGLLTLSGAETNCSCAALQAKVASGPKATLLVLNPRVLAVVSSGTLSAGSAGGGTLGTLLGYDVTGCFLKTTGGTGGGGTGGANNQARKIITYNTGTGAFTVSPNWETTPDNTTTYEVLLPDGVTLGMLKALNSTSPIQTAGDIYSYLTTNVGALGANLSAIPKTGFKLASDGLASVSAWTVAITGNITGNLSGSVGSVTAGVTLAAAAIQAIWDAATSALTTVGSIGKMLVDKLNGVSGQVASQSEVTSIQNNTRVVRSVPAVIERPDSGTTTYRIELFLYDDVGNMEAPDSAPTLALVDQGGTDLSARLDSTTGSSVSTGRYRWIYTASDTDDLEQLNWTFSVVEGGATRLYGNQSLIVDTTAADFTSSDRSTLNTLATEMAKVPKSDSNVTWNPTAAAQIQSEANDALVANHLDHLFAATYDPASKPGVADALLNELVESDGGVSRFTANALEEAPGTPLARVEFEISVKSTAGLAAQISAWLTIGGELVDIEGLDPTPTLSVTVREHGSGVDLFTATGDASDIFNSRFEIEQALPNFVDDRQYAADVEIDVDGTVYATSHVFTVQGA